MLAKPEYLWALVVTAAAAAVALTVSAQLGWWLLFFSALGWWAWQAPVAAVAFFIMVAPLLPMFKMTQTIGTVTLLKDVLILVLFTKLIAWPLFTRKLPYRRNILLGPIVGLIIWVGFALLRSDGILLGILRAREIVLYILLYFVVLYLPPGKTVYRQLALWFGMSAAVVAALGYYQFYFLPDSAVLRFDPVREIWIPRVSSVLAHPSIFGHYLILASGVLATSILQWSRKWWLYALGFVAFVPLVYLTYSRAVWLGYVAALAALGLGYFRSLLGQRRAVRFSWPLVSLGIVGLVIVLIVAARFTSAGVFLRSAFDPTYGSNAERLEFLARLIAPLSNTQALVGAGLGDVLQQNFREVDVTTFDIASGASRSVQLAKNATLVDNQYLKTLIEMGLVGLLIYGWLYWRVFRGAARITNSKSQITRIIGLWALGFLAAFVLQGFFIDIWDIFPTNAAFWIIAALVSREQIPYTADHEED